MCLDVTHVLLIIMVRAEPVGIVFDVLGTEVPILYSFEYLLGVAAEPDSEMIDEVYAPARVDLRVEGHLRKRRAAMNQPSPGVVADTAAYGSSDA